MTRRHSLLFVPASRPERIPKALATGADAVVVDLEDAVPPGEKDAARAGLAAVLDRTRPVLLRVNGADTEWFAADLEVLAHPGIAGALLPKAEDPDDAAVVARACRGKPVLPLIESALGFDRRRELAMAAGVERLVFGHIDFQADMNLRATEDELLPFRLELVLASRLADIAPPIDGVTVAFDDEAQLRADARRARRLGFGGKLCIHPRQVGVVNACFAPSPEEVAWAQRVVEADGAARGAAVAVDGRMVDRPVVLRARAVLAEARGRSA